MEQTGYVVSAGAEGIKVRVDRESACGGNCVSCKGCPSSAVIVDAVDGEGLGLRKGDVVTLYEDTKKVLRYAAIGYGLMAVLLVVGAVLGFILTRRDFMALIGAAAALLIGFLIVKLFFRNVQSAFTVTEIKSRADDPKDQNDTGEPI